MMEEYNVEIRKPTDTSSQNMAGGSPGHAYSQRSQSPERDDGRPGYLSPVVYDAPLPNSGTSDRLQSIQASPHVATIQKHENKIAKLEEIIQTLNDQISALKTKELQLTEEAEDYQILNKEQAAEFGQVLKELEDWTEAVAALGDGKRTDALEVKEKLAWDRVAVRLGSKAKPLRERVVKVLAKKKGFF